METYRVAGGTFRLGLGEICELTDAQIAPRLHKLTIMQKVEGWAICRADGVLQFKAGEMLKLASPPPKSMADVIVCLDPDPAPAKPPARKVKPPKGDKVSDPAAGQAAAERQEKIVAAIGSLDALGYGADGVPDVKAIEAVFGFDISAGERDEAWATMKAARAAA